MQLIFDHYAEPKAGVRTILDIPNDLSIDKLKTCTEALTALLEKPNGAFYLPVGLDILAEQRVKLTFKFLGSTWNKIKGTLALYTLNKIYSFLGRDRYIKQFNLEV